MNVAVKYTYQDLLTTPEDGNKYEIFQGELVISPSPNERHQFTHSNLFGILWSYVTSHSLGRLYSTPFDVYFDEETVLQPDLLFVSDGRLDIVEHQRVKGAPDVVFEILSESTESRDRGFKFKRYAQEGIREYWIVDPDTRTIEIYDLKEEGYALSGKFTGKDEVRSPFFVDLRFSADKVFG